MSKKAQKYLNPPFDPRMLSIGPPSLGSSKLQRGRLVMAEADGTTGVKHGVHFLYNPVAVTATHNIDNASIDSGAYAQPSTASTQNGQLVNIGGVSVDLLYDRTYELWDRSQKNTLAGRFGVYSDVLAFYYTLGITGEGSTNATNISGTGNPFSDFYNTHTANESGTTTMWQTLYPVKGINPANMMYLYIGDKMRFYGTVSDFAVTYSHWSHEMIPTRCQVSISMQFQSDPAAQKHHITRHHQQYHAVPGSGAGNILIPGSTTGVNTTTSLPGSGW